MAKDAKIIRWNLDRLVDQVRSVCEVDENGCWIWRYGSFSDDRYPEIMILRRRQLVARWILEVTTGEVGDVARHQCGRKLCCNPGHLSWETLRKSGRGRRANVALGACGVPTRLGPAITRTYDFGFFDHFTPESAYWAGFLAADGCVRSTRATVSLRLAVADFDHVEKFRRAVHYNGEVKTSGSAAYLHINGPRWVISLKRNFNITPRKSLTYSLPALPSDALPHFIRGVIDGDGSITRTSVPSLHIRGTRSLLEDFSEIFFNHCGVRLKSKNRVPPIRLQANGASGQASWSGQNAAKILRWAYTGSTNATRLDRKYAKWQELWPSTIRNLSPDFEAHATESLAIANEETT